MVHTTFERLPEEKKNRILQASRARRQCRGIYGKRFDGRGFYIRRESDSCAQRNEVQRVLFKRED